MKVIQGDSLTASLLLSGNRTKDYTSHIKNAYEKLSNVLVDKDSVLSRTVQDIHKRFNSSALIDRAKRLLRKEGVGTRNESTISRYDDPRRVNRIMRDYVMANKEIRHAYGKGLIDGYSEDYISDKAIENDRYNLATDGIIDEVTGNYEVLLSLDVLDLEEERLDIEEQIDILDTWKSASKMLNTGIDPTDRF